MKKMLSLLTLALCLVAVPVLAEKCCGNNKPRPGIRKQNTQGDATDKCCGNNKPRPSTRNAETNVDATDKCGCNANKPKTTVKGCNNCGCKPCGGCCGNGNNR